MYLMKEIEETFCIECDQWVMPNSVCEDIGLYECPECGARIMED